MEQGENFSADQQENFRMENEFLKIKLKAQYGDAFDMGSSEDMPPEIENQFLRSMMAFEEEHTETDFISVYERIGKPAYKLAVDMQPPELNAALKTLRRLLEHHDIELNISDGPYPDDIIYRFITEELLGVKVEKKPVAGLTTHFLYEEFHPNHHAEINRRAHVFLANWFNRKFSEYSTELSWHCVTPAGIQLTREDVIAKMKIFFDAFRRFKDDGYNIDAIKFDLDPANDRGTGYAEGMLKYDAVIDDGELLHYEGRYKLYLQLEDNWWSIFYFVLPGFKW